MLAHDTARMFELTNNGLEQSMEEENDVDLEDGFAIRHDRKALLQLLFSIQEKESSIVSMVV